VKNIRYRLPQKPFEISETLKKERCTEFSLCFVAIIFSFIDAMRSLNKKRAQKVFLKHFYPEIDNSILLLLLLFL